MNNIITFLVTSSGDLKDWVSVSATCKELRNVATEPNILRVIKFQNLMMNRPEQHLHINGLLSRCVRAGNMNAEYMMGKAILYGEAPLWETMLENDLTARSIKCATALPFFERCGRIEQWRKDLCLSALNNSYVNLETYRDSYNDEELLQVAYTSRHFTQLEAEAFPSL